MFQGRCHPSAVPQCRLLPSCFLDVICSQHTHTRSLDSLYQCITGPLLHPSLPEVQYLCSSGGLRSVSDRPRTYLIVRLLLEAGTSRVGKGVKTITIRPKRTNSTNDSSILQRNRNNDTTARPRHPARKHGAAQWR